jgi:hypothetical protein
VAEPSGAAGERGIGTVAMEAVVALLLAGTGALAVWDARRLGAGWGSDGPQAGYFPLWLGLLLIAASLGNLVSAFRHGRGEVFATWPQLRLVLAVLTPTVVYVALIPPLGLYLASTLFIAWFMIVLGRFSWRLALPFGLAAAVLVFAVFELWFLVPLPKGPVEAALGF